MLGVSTPKVSVRSAGIVELPNTFETSAYSNVLRSLALYGSSQ